MRSPVAVIKPGFFTIWWTAIRPRTLGVALAPVAAGTALALADGAALDWLVLLATVASALLIQIGTNLHNDAADYESGTDQAERVGPLRVTQAGWVPARTVKRAALLTFVLALLLGVYLVVAGGPLILAIGVASLLAGWGYSGGPRPISRTPLGELFVLAFFGILAVAGSHWLQSRLLSWHDLAAGLAIGFPAAAVLLVNNYRDLETDRKSGRRTLAGLLGQSRARRLYALLVLAPFPLVLGMAVAGLPGAAAGLLLLPRFVGLVRSFTPAAAGAELNGLLARTAASGCLLGLLVAAGVGLTAS